MRTGIVAALPEELSLLFNRIPEPGVVASPREGVFCILSGVGARCASESVKKLIEEGVDRLLSWGCAGGLAPEVQPGDLLLPKRVISSDGEEWSPDEIWRQRMQRDLEGVCVVREGPLYSSRDPVITESDRKRLYEETGAVAVDMESGAVVQIASEQGIPCLIVRAAADCSKSGIPACISDSIDRDGFVNRRILFRKLLVRPSEWAKTIRLAREFRAACSTLSLTAQKTDMCIR